MTPAALRDKLCSTFCGDLTVREVPAGIAVSAMFEANDGDRLSCLVERSVDGWRISDDGAFLGDLTGYGIDVGRGGRSEFLARALRPSGARVDEATLQIVAELEHDPEPSDVLAFLTALSRAQDVAFWTKERVRSTFREDATQVLREVLGDAADLESGKPIDQSLVEFPPDLIIRPKGYQEGSAITAVFLVQAIDALQEALLLSLELRTKGRRDIRVSVLVEDGQVNMSTPKAARAVNRIDSISFFRNDEREAAIRVARTAVPGLKAA